MTATCEHCGGTGLKLLPAIRDMPGLPPEFEPCDECEATGRVRVYHRLTGEDERLVARLADSYATARATAGTRYHSYLLAEVADMVTNVLLTEPGSAPLALQPPELAEDLEEVVA
jgi:Ribonuclease G/E